MLVGLIDRTGAVSVGQMVDTLKAHGFHVVAPANKTVSDALRRQLARGRVTRPHRGIYAPGTMPKSTRYYRQA